MVVCRALLACILALSLSGCGDFYRYLKSGEVGWTLKTELRDKNSKRVELVKLTKFAWDELFLFDPYTPTNEVCNRLSLPAAECKSIITTESDDDGVVLMVFRLGGKVVHSELHFRWHGDFTPAPREPLTASTAVFAVATDSHETGWLKLRTAH